MSSFHDIIGQNDIIEYLNGAISNGQVAHAYMFDGEKGTGKKMLARIFAQTLLCEKHGTDPCGECHSCKMAESGNNPDIITVIHEKPNVISVQEIRDQVVNDVQIKPYGNDRKVYIISDAHLMNVQAQNALLKTLEEPPSYAVIILLCDNKAMMLSTLISRSIVLSMRAVKNELILDYLKDKYQIPEHKAYLASAFAQGNLGKAVVLASSEEFTELWDKVHEILIRISEMDEVKIAAAAKEAAAWKDQKNDLLDLMLMWYRDVLMIKAGGDAEQLIYGEDQREIERQADNYSYEALNKIILMIQQTARRIDSNVNFELAMELLFLEMKGT
ncbi:DNA polymerase-3 subunit delta' [Lachnospiraceae bacterium]|nr:DNA polymerase-3 subunit delta' [Lachnospiraceae bacterium]